MTIQTIPDIKPEILLETFNEAFAEYFVPVQVTASQMRDKMLNDGIDLSISVGAFDQGRLIGFILHGSGMIDGLKTVYNAGTGVLPSYRGQGLTRRMYEFIIPGIKEQGYQLSVLEAITENTPAIKVYESVGFKPKRAVHCFRGNIGSSNRAGDWKIAPISLPENEIIQQWWDWQPTWQNSWAAACRMIDQFQVLGAFRREQLIGYVSYHPVKGRIQQVAVHPQSRRQGVATSLVEQASRDCGVPMSVINIDEMAEADLAFFPSLGMEKLLGQYEMKLPIG